MPLAQDCLLGGVGRSLHCGPHRQVSQELASYPHGPCSFLLWAPIIVFFLGEPCLN